MEGFLYLLLYVLFFIVLPVAILTLCWKFKRIAATIIALIIIEKITLKLMEPVILKNHKVIEEFAAKNISSPSNFDMNCEKVPIFVIYSYKVCIDGVARKGGRLIKIQFPAGYLTFIPRDYPDRILFDGKILGLLETGGKIQYYGE